MEEFQDHPVVDLLQNSKFLSLLEVIHSKKTIIRNVHQLGQGHLFTAEQIQKRIIFPICSHPRQADGPVPAVHEQLANDDAHVVFGTFLVHGHGHGSGILHGWQAILVFDIYFRSATEPSVEQTWVSEFDHLEQKTK